MTGFSRPGISIKLHHFFFCALLICGGMALGGSERQTRLNFRFDHFTSAMGLSHNDVGCVYQDQSGVLWIGTEDGLSWFNGYDFKNMVY